MNKTKKPKIEFIAIAQFGWRYASSPAMAIHKVKDLSFLHGRPLNNSGEWVEAQESIQLWMVRSDEWKGIDRYRPMDHDWQPCGVLLHGYTNKEDQLATYERMSEAAYAD